MIHRDDRKVLILGGTRFIGKRVLAALLRDGYRNLTLLHRGLHEDGTEHAGCVTHVHGDRNNPLLLHRLAGRHYDVVIDMSGEQSESVRTAVEAFNGRSGMYVFCSSSSVFWLSGPTDVVSEDSPRRSPDGPPSYATEKVRAELHVETIRQRHYILRPCKVYGPGNHIERESRYRDIMLRERLVRVPTGFDPLLHFTYVDDVADAFVAVIRNQPHSPVYNVSGPAPERFRDYLHTMAGVLGCRDQLVIQDTDGPCVCPYGDASSMTVDHRRLAADTSWRPRVPLVDGLKRTFADKTIPCL